MSIARPGTNSSGSQACAACRFQRRKCAPNCPLAPYFPPDQQKQFLNAHKLFGVSNIMKVLRTINDPCKKDTAIKTMIIQANVRARDPVGGCHRIHCDIQRQIDHVLAELDHVQHQLAICRAQAALHHMQEPINAAEIHGQTLHADPLSIYNPMINHHHNLQPMDDRRPLYVQPLQEQQRYLVHDNYHTQGLNGHDITSSSCSQLEGKHPFVDDSEDLKPLLGIFDEGQPVSFDSKESIQYSDKVVLKEDVDSIQHEQEHDLKGAASLFSLTNCND